MDAEDRRSTRGHSETSGATTAGGDGDGTGGEGGADTGAGSVASRTPPASGPGTSTIPAKRRRGPGLVTANACTECRKKRARCSGEKPACARCLSHNVPECVYEIPVRQSKETLRNHIEELRQRQCLNDQVFSALRLPGLSGEILNRLRSGQSLEAISDWIKDAQMQRKDSGASVATSTATAPLLPPPPQPLSLPPPPLSLPQPNPNHHPSGSMSMSPASPSPFDGPRPRLPPLNIGIGMNIGPSSHTPPMSQSLGSSWHLSGGSSDRGPNSGYRSPSFPVTASQMNHQYYPPLQFGGPYQQGSSFGASRFPHAQLPQLPHPPQLPQPQLPQPQLPQPQLPHPSQLPQPSQPFQGQYYQNRPHPPSYSSPHNHSHSRSNSLLNNISSNNNTNNINSHGHNNSFGNGPANHIPPTTMPWSPSTNTQHARTGSWTGTNPSQPPAGPSTADFRRLQEMASSVVAAAAPPTSPPASTWTEVSKDHKLVEHLLSLYFCWEYPTFATLSKEHFVQDFHNGRDRYCSQILVNALLALGCRFSTWPSSRADPTDPYTSGDHFFKESQRLFRNETNHHSLTTIQALGIMSIREASCGRDSESWYYAGQSIRLAIEMGLHRIVDGEGTDEMAVQSATFWGAFALDHAWSLATGTLPHCSWLIRLPPKPSIISSIEASLWVPYTDDGAPLQRSCEQPSNVRSVYRCFCELSELVHTSLYTMHAPGKPLTASDLLALYNKYINWYDSIPDVLRLGQNFTPAVLFAHMYYHFAILLLFRPLIKLRIIGSKLIPRDLCLQAAEAIQNLLNSYSRLYTLQRTPSFVPYFLLTSSIMHLAIAAIIDHENATKVEGGTSNSNSGDVSSSDPSSNASNPIDVEVGGSDSPTIPISAGVGGGNKATNPIGVGVGGGGGSGSDHPSSGSTGTTSHPDLGPKISAAISQTISDLTEMVPCHHFAEQALNIIRYLTKKWKLNVNFGQSVRQGAGKLRRQRPSVLGGAGPRLVAKGGAGGNAPVEGSNVGVDGEVLDEDKKSDVASLDAEMTGMDDDNDMAELEVDYDRLVQPRTSSLNFFAPNVREQDFVSTLTRGSMSELADDVLGPTPGISMSGASAFATCAGAGNIPIFGGGGMSAATAQAASSTQNPLFWPFPMQGRPILPDGDELEKAGFVFL